MALREKQTSTLNKDILSVQDRATQEKSNEHILIVFNQDQMTAADASIPHRHTKSELNSKVVSTYNVANGGMIKSQMPGNKRRDMIGQSQFEKTQTKERLQLSDEVSSHGGAEKSGKNSFKLQSDANRGTRMNLNQLQNSTMQPSKDGQFLRMDTVFDVLVATDQDGRKSSVSQSRRGGKKNEQGHEEPAVLSHRKQDTQKHQELKAALNQSNNSPRFKQQVEVNVATTNQYSNIQTPNIASVKLNQTIDPKTLFNKVDKLKQGTQFKISRQGQRTTKNKSVLFDPNDKGDVEAKTLFLHNKTRLQALKLNVLKDVEKFSSINPVNTSVFDNKQTRNCKTSQSYNRPKNLPMKIKHLNPLQVPVPLRYGNYNRIEEDAKKHIMVQELASKRFSGLSGALSTDRNKVNSRQQQRTKSQQMGFQTNEVEMGTCSKQSVHILGEKPMIVNTPPMEDTDKQPQSISEEPNSAMVLSDIHMQQASPRFYEEDPNKMSQIVSMDQRVPTDHVGQPIYHLPAQDYIDKSYPSASSSFADPNGIQRFKKAKNYVSPPLQRPQARNCQTSQNPRIKNINLQDVGGGLNGVNAREINLFTKHPKNVEGFDAPIVHQQNQRYKQLRKINNKDIIDDQESSHMGSYMATSPLQMNSTLNENDHSRQRKDTSIQKRRREYLRNQEIQIIDFILKQYLRYRQKQSEYKNYKSSLDDNENQIQNMAQNFEYTYMMAYMKQRNIYSFSYFRKYNLDKFSNNPIAHRIAKQVLSSLDPYRQMEHVKIDDFVALRKKLIEKSIIKKIQLPQPMESHGVPVNNALSQKDEVESELVRGGETGSNTIRNFGSSQSPKTRRGNHLAVLSAHQINGRQSVISDRSRASGSHTPDHLMVTFSETQDARQHATQYQDYPTNPTPNNQLRLVNKKSTLPQHGNVHIQRDQSPKVKIVHRAAIFEQSIDVLNSNTFKPEMKQKYTNKKLSMSITDTTENQVGFKSILPDNLDYGISDFEQYVALIIQSQSISEQIDKKATNISRSRKHRFGSDFRLDMTSLIDRKIFNSLKPQIHIPSLDLNKQIGRRIRVEKIEAQIKKLQMIKEPTAQNKLEIETLKQILRTMAPDSRLLRSIEYPLRSNRPNQTTYRQSTMERESHDFSLQERGSAISQCEYSICEASQIRQSEESEKLEVKAVGLNINKHKNHNALKLRMLQQQHNNMGRRSQSQLEIPVGSGLDHTQLQTPQDFTNAFEQCSKLPQNIMNLESIGREDKELSNTLYRTTPKSGTMQGYTNKPKKINARLHAININQIQAAPSENFQRIDLETVRIRQKTHQMSNKSSASVPISHSSNNKNQNNQSTIDEPYSGQQDMTPGIRPHEGITPSVKQVSRYSTLKKRDEQSRGDIMNCTISEKNNHDNRSDMSIKSSRYQNGKRSILIKSSVDQNLQGNFDPDQQNSRDEATNDELDQDNRMDSQMDTNQDQQNSLDNQLNTHTMETAVMNKKQVEELMKKVSQGSSIQDIFPNGSIMFRENEQFQNQQQISIEDDSLDLRTDHLMITMDGQNDYNENVDLLSSEKKTRGNTRAGARTSTKTGIKLPTRRIIDSKDDSAHQQSPNLHLLEQLSSCYGVMSPAAKKQQQNSNVRRLQSRQKKTRGKNEDLDQILAPLKKNNDRGRNSITNVSKEGSHGEHLTTQQSKSRNQVASKTITPMMSYKYHIAPQYKIDKKTPITPVVANQPTKPGQIKHDYFKFKTLQQRATKPQRSNRKEKEKSNKKKQEPLITSARNGRDNSKNTARDQRSKSNTVTPRTTREQRDHPASNSHSKNQALSAGLKSHEASIQNKFMNDLRESIMYMQNMQITGNQLTQANHLESLNISMQENALSLHNSTVEQQEQLRKLQNQTVPIPTRSQSPMSHEVNERLEMENQMMLTHHLEEFNMLQLQQLQSPPASYIPPERQQISFNLAQIGHFARNYQNPAYRNQILQQGQIQSMIYKNRNNLCLQK